MIESKQPIIPQLTDFFKFINVDNLFLYTSEANNFFFTYNLGSFSWCSYGTETISNILTTVSLDFSILFTTVKDDSILDLVTTTTINSNFKSYKLDFSYFKDSSVIIIGDVFFLDQRMININNFYRSIRDLNKFSLNVSNFIKKISTLRLQYSNQDINKDSQRIYI